MIQHYIFIHFLEIAMVRVDEADADLLTGSVPT